MNKMFAYTMRHFLRHSIPPFLDSSKTGILNASESCGKFLAQPQGVTITKIEASAAINRRTINVFNKIKIRNKKRIMNYRVFVGSVRVFVGSGLSILR